MRSLKVVQGTAKVLRVLFNIAKVILYIFAVIVLAAACILLATGETPDGPSAIISTEGLINGDYKTVSVMMFGMLSIIIGACITMTFVCKYFKMLVKDGTPFTYSGSKYLRRVGIISIVTTLLSVVLSISIFAYAGLSSNIQFDVSIGIWMILISYLFEYGAYLAENQKQPEPEDALPAITEETAD